MLHHNNLGRRSTPRIEPQGQRRRRDGLARRHRFCGIGSGVTIRMGAAGGTWGARWRVLTGWESASATAHTCRHGIQELQGRHDKRVSWGGGKATGRGCQGG